MAKEKLTKEQTFTELSDYIEEFFIERLNNFNIPIDLKFYFQANKKQKTLINLTKIPDQYSVILNKDILVQVNEDYFDSFNSEQDINTILIDQSIDLIEYNLEKGTFKVNTPKFRASESIVDKYSYEKVARAIEVERLYEKQKNDKDDM